MASTSTEATGTAPCSGDLCWLLSHASHVLTTELTAALDDLGISPRAHQVLSSAMTGDHTQIELARIVGLDKTTMVVTLDELQRSGLATRQPSQADRRARVIAVTDAGRRKVREAEKVTAAVRADVLGALPDDEREVFVGALQRLVGERLRDPVACSQPVRRRAVRG